MKVLNKISNFLLSIYAIIFAFGIFMTWTNFKVKVELPINDFSGFVVDNNDNIYIGDSFYSIIQKYDKNGFFLESFRINETKGKPFRFRIDNEDNIIVTSKVINDIVVYPYYNREINFKVKNLNANKELKVPNTIFKNLKNEKFENTGKFYTSIWKINPDKRKIVEQSVFLKFISFPSLMIIVLTALIIKIAEYLIKKLQITVYSQKRV